MRNGILSLALIITVLAGAMSLEAKPVKVKISNPGSLQSVLPASKARKGSPVVIEGTLNNDDIRHLRALCGSDTLFRPVEAVITDLDLSHASFAEGGSEWFAKGERNSYSVTSPHSLPASIFCMCPITSLTLPERLDSIGMLALGHTNLTEINIPDGVVVDRTSVYNDTLLTTLRLPFMSRAVTPARNRLPRLRSMTYGGFDYMSGGSYTDCDAIEEVIFDGPIGHIDGFQFESCPSLKRVVFNGPINTTGGARFATDCPQLETVEVNGLAINYGLLDFDGCPLLKGVTVNGAVLVSDNADVVAEAPIAEIAARPELVAQLKEIADWQITQLSDHRGGFLVRMAHDMAPKTIDLAIAAGLPDIAAGLTAALDSSKDNDEFKTKLQILKESPDYAADNVQYTITYSEPGDSMLTLTREYYNLDSVAGDGDDISRIKNLLYWVHELVRHDGGSPWPQCGLNCREIAEVCNRDNRGVNCRMMAIMLTEALLAEGIPARYLTCESKAWDIDNDCHVICVAWSSSLGKWIWVDPTFAAYVTDENGVLLHPGEVRYRLQHDLPLVLNDDANWNHEITQTKEDYLGNYMAKNLYHISCNTINQANPEGIADHPQGSTVTLAPVGSDYHSQTGTVTTDSSRFWQSPE